MRGPSLEFRYQYRTFFFNIGGRYRISALNNGIIMKLCNARWRQFNSHLPRNANSWCHYKGAFYQSAIKCFILMALNLTHQCMKRFGNVFLMRCELPCEVYVYATPRGVTPSRILRNTLTKTITSWSWHLIVIKLISNFYWCPNFEYHSQISNYDGVNQHRVLEISVPLFE